MRVTRLMRASVAAGLVLGPTLTVAQQPREIKMTPFVGVYAPTAKVGTMNTTIEGSNIAASLKQRAGFAFGATGSYWWNKRVGFELGGTYALSNARGTFNSSTTDIEQTLLKDSENSHVIFGSARLMWGILPLGEDAQLRLSAGPAIVNRGGKAYRAEAEGKFLGLTDLGGVVSLCTRIPMTELLAIRIRAEDYMYQSQLKVRTLGTDVTGTYPFDKAFQHDLVLSAGLQLGFRR